MNRVKPLLRSLSILVLLAAVPLAPAMAAGPDESAVPTPFQGDTPGSKLHIKYDDLSLMLEQTVLVTGMSDRGEAGTRIVPAAGSHIARGPSGANRLEGNRVDFHAFLGSNYDVLVGLRKSLEAVPSQVPMEELSREEQLAYWLNLYNVTMLTQIAEIFPAANLKQYHKGGSLRDEKVLNVAGMPLSLNDIHHNILIPKFRNPLVMYGLFQGVIGGPNLRAEAYEGHKVYSQLQANAREFINSNRGAKMRDRLLRVSYFYEENAALFPDWSADVRAHLMDYAKPEFQEKIAGASSAVGAVLDNWYVADLYGGSRSLSSANTNRAALLGAFKSGGGIGTTGSGLSVTGTEGEPGGGDYGGYAGGAQASSWVAKLGALNPYTTRFPMHMIDQLKKIEARKRKLREGEVGVEEIDDAVGGDGSRE